MARGPAIAGPRRPVGYLGGNWEPGAGGAKLAVGAVTAGLFVTPNTLKTHLLATYRKLGAESREEAVIRAREGGLIKPQGRGPAVAGPRGFEVPCRQRHRVDERRLRRLTGYLGGNWELGAGGARLAVGAWAV